MSKVEISMILIGLTLFSVGTANLIMLGSEWGAAFELALNDHTFLIGFLLGILLAVVFFVTVLRISTDYAMRQLERETNDARRYTIE